MTENLRYHGIENSARMAMERMGSDKALAGLVVAMELLNTKENYYRCQKNACTENRISKAKGVQC